MVSAVVASLLLVGGCGVPSSSPDAQGEPSSGESDPDVSKLEVAIHLEPQAQGSGYIVQVSCIAGVSWDGRFYVISSSPSGRFEDPQPGEKLEDVVVPGCNDTGQNLEPDTPTAGWTIEGVDPDKAILVRYP